MSNAATFLAGLASIANHPRVEIEVSKLTFHRSREEPTDPKALEERNARRRALAESWLDGPLSDIIVRDGDYAIADGNERVSGLLLLGTPKITVALLPATTPDSELDKISLVTDFHKQALTPFEKANVAKRLLDSTGARKGELAAQLKIDAGNLTKHLALFDCQPEVIEAARAGRIGLTDWYAISKSDDQLCTLGLKLSGASRDELAANNKKTRKAVAPAVRASSIKCPLPSGHTVVIKGDELSLEEAVEVLATASKAIKEGIKRNFTAKTFQAAAKDMAAAG